MRAPAFWWRPRPGALALLLQPLGWIYGAVTLRRMRQPGARLAIPVICVGNFIAGGAGKTPTGIAVARLLQQRGHTPFMLTRGYGGSLPGPVEVDNSLHSASEVGDEALLLARQARTIVARDRAAGAALAVSLGADVIVMDDGLQNPSLEKQLRLAVVDGASGVGNGLCLPAGPLRAPLSGQLEATDAVIVIGDGEAGEAVAETVRARGIPVLGARIEPAPETAARLSGTKVIAVSGIGRPEKFVATLRAAGATLAGSRTFGDHHPYSASDVSGLISDARAQNCLIATTEKDMTKLGQLWPEAERERLIVVPITLRLDEPAVLASLLGHAAPKR